MKLVFRIPFKPYQSDMKSSVVKTAVLVLKKSIPYVWSVENIDDAWIFLRVKLLEAIVNLAKYL